MDVIIVGAGIAGLSAGIGLRRAGHRVTVRIFFWNLLLLADPSNHLSSFPASRSSQASHCASLSPTTASHHQTDTRTVVASS